MKAITAFLTFWYQDKEKKDLLLVCWQPINASILDLMCKLIAAAATLTVCGVVKLNTVCYMMLAVQHAKISNSVFYWSCHHCKGIAISTGIVIFLT